MIYPRAEDREHLEAYNTCQNIDIQWKRLMTVNFMSKVNLFSGLIRLVNDINDSISGSVVPSVSRERERKKGIIQMKQTQL